jgi:hypothetical protein
MSLMTHTNLLHRHTRMHLSVTNYNKYRKRSKTKHTITAISQGYPMQSTMIFSLQQVVQPREVTVYVRRDAK